MLQMHPLPDTDVSLERARALALEIQRTSRS